jgi:LytS/YehU family sensor histidine kinase
MIPVSEELKFLEDYLFLQKIRFGENLRVNISLEPVAGRMVIPLSLQMLVENAIKHNEISGEHPLSIDISSSVELSIVIKNSLNKKNVVDNSLGVGIENLKKRVAFFTDQPLIIEEKVSEFFVTMPTVST